MIISRQKLICGASRNLGMLEIVTMAHDAEHGSVSVMLSIYVGNGSIMFDISPDDAFELSKHLAEASNVAAAAQQVAA